MKVYKCYEFIKNETGFDQLKFLSNIVSDDETRYFMMNIFVDVENIVSSDGRIMGVLKNEKKFNIEPGYYYRIKGTANKIIIAKNNKIAYHYPNYKKVFPDYKKKYKEGCIDFRGLKSESIIYIFGRDNNLPKFNPKYLKLFPADKYIYYYQKGSHGVIFESQSIDFKIMFVDII